MVRLRFDAWTGDDDDAFTATRDALLGELDEWLATRGARGDGSLLAAARLFVDWRFGYSTGDLDRYEDWEIGEFLLEWCPRKYSAPADSADDVCHGVARFAEFMAETGRLVGGRERAAEIAVLAERAAPAMFEAMGDSSRFGMAKSLFAGAFDQLDSIDDPAALQRVLDQRMAEFNALPFDERRAITEPALAGLGAEQFELPFLVVPPADAEVRAAAEASPLLVKFAALRDYLGHDGLDLTAKGNLKLADGRALVELLDTGDRFDEKIGDRTFRTTSTGELRGLRLVVELAKRSGAVRVHRRRLTAVKAWAGRDPVERAVAAVRVAVEWGPLALLFGDRGRRVADVADLVDDGLVHWMTMLLPAGLEAPFEEISAIVAAAADSIADLDPQYWNEDRIGRVAARYLASTVEVLELLNVLEWNESVDEPTDFGTTERSGGVLRLTPLGRHALVELAARAGYRVRTIVPLAEATAADLLAVFEEIGDADIPAVVATWQPALAADERAARVADAIVAADSPRHRLAGFAVFDALGVGAAQVHVRRLLDTSVAGHAAAWLMAHELADEEAVGGFVGIGVLVDVLAATLDDPGELGQLFLASPTVADAEHALQLMWRHDAPETAAVLDALGRHLPDRHLAKAARKAALQHRSWMASRR